MLAVTNDTALVALHGTVADEMYQLLSKQTLTDAVWLAEGKPFLGGDALTLTTFPVLDRTNSLFLQARSWQDSGGSGLPDWWQIQHFGQTGVDPYGDPDGDGWGNLQEYQQGTNPHEFAQPPAPMPFLATLDQTKTSVILTWNPAPGPVSHFVLQRRDWDDVAYEYGPWMQIATPAGGERSIQDPGSFIVEDPEMYFSTDTYAARNSIYRIYGVYSNGNSQAVEATIETGDVSLAVDAQLVCNNSGRWELICPAISPQVERLRLEWFEYYYEWEYGWLVSTEEIPVSSLFNGRFSFSDSVVTNHLFFDTGIVGASGSVLWVRGVNSVGRTGMAVNAGQLFSDNAPYFVDGREHAKENLNFQIRAATSASPIPIGDACLWGGLFFPYDLPGNMDYIESGFLQWAYRFSLFGSPKSFIRRHNLWPFYLNHKLHHLAFDTNQVPDFKWEPDFQTVPTPPVLGYLDPCWISRAIGTLPEVAAGVSDDSVFLNSGGQNLFGLEYEAALVAIYEFDSSNYIYLALQPLPPGTSRALNARPLEAFYNQTGAPVLQPAGYYFAPVLSPGGNINAHFPQATEQPFPLPVNFDFSITNETPILIVSAGQSSVIAGWSKARIASSTGKMAYLGQYFEGAYRSNSIGDLVLSTNDILSPYGDFFPTEPGPVALITMPNWGENVRGTGIVHVISLNVDANHDGDMDLRYHSTDQTTPNHPFRFWVNNDCDFSDSSSNPGRDLDYYAKDNVGNFINSQRDLEDLARLWVCGMPVLTNGTYQVTLSISAQSGNPAIRLFSSVETNGGRGYLTDTNVAAAQVVSTGIFAGPKWAVGTISSSQFYTFPATFFTNSGNKFFLFEGADIGTGQLTLTISQTTGPSSNVLAQTSAWLDLRDIKSMYQRVRVTPRDPNGIPRPWTSTTTFDENSAGVEAGGDGEGFNPPADEDETVTVFVHGSNLSVPSAIENAETMFKRLYWQGYHGRFVSFCWNTLVGPWDGAIPAHYNYNEFRAFKYGLALKNYVENELPDNYSKNVIGHSMGNMVIASALYPRGSTPGMTCRNVILMQAAVPASCFDPEADTLAELDGLENPQQTPNDFANQWGYRGLVATNINATLYNIYNAQDYALGWWVNNQILCKPENLTIPVPRSMSRSYVWSTNTLTGYLFDSTTQVRTVTDPHESMAFIARSRTEAVGRLETGGSVNILNNYNIGLNTPVSFGGSRSDHSGQFTRPNQQLVPFYTFIYDVITTP